MPSRARTRIPVACPAVRPARAGDTDARPDLWDLLDRARAGDSAAFGEFFNATFDTVLPYVLRRVGDRDTAEDITADVYLAAWRGLAGVQRVAGSPAAWLRTIAQRKVVDHHRAAYRRPAVPSGTTADLALLASYRPPAPAAGQQLTDRPAEAVALEHTEARALWDYAAQQLTPDQYRVLRCRYGLGLSLDQTAAELGKRPTAVKTLQARAVRNLRDLLGGRPVRPRRAAAV